MAGTAKIGIIVGSWFATSVAGRLATGSDGKINYQTLFSIPMWIAIACFLVLLVAYPRRSVPRPSAQ